MPGREEMLKRIRKALGRPAEGPGLAPKGVDPSPQDLAGVMPPTAPEELLPKFEAEWANVGGSTHRATTKQEVEETLRTILANLESPNVVLSRNPLLAQLGIAETLRAGGKSVAVGPKADSSPSDNAAFRKQSFEAVAGITGVDFVLAETGSLVLSSVTEGSQLASLAPPVHIALYQRSQLIGSLDEVLARLPVPRGPDEPLAGRSVVFITGTSRTADIEQILVRGVHGPREVHAILVEESCLR